MAKSTEETKQTAVDILTAVQSIYPQLREVAKKTDFEITITGDKKKVYVEFSVDWDPTEDDVKVEEVAENVNIEEGEKERLAKALQQTNGDKRKAAELVGLSERTFFRKCKEYGLKK